MDSPAKAWEEYAKFVGTSASIWTIIQMLAPVPICYHIIRKKSVGDMTVTPYTSALTSSFLWLVYGVIINDQAVIKVNVIAVALQILYISCYFLFTSKKNYVQKQLGCAFLFLSSMLTYIYVEDNHDRVVSFLGFVASIVTVFFFASPLMNVGYVIRIWNSESLPRPLIIATFIVSVQWTLYGYLINDNFIIVTNLLGTILSFIQVGVMFIIPRDSKLVPLISKEKESKTYPI